LYPQAKIVLTVREAEAWYASISQTIFATQAKPLPTDNLLMRDGITMAKKFMQCTFDGRTNDPGYVIDVYEQHNQAVQTLVAADRLLVFDVADGWPPLCRFLDCATLNEAFPRANSRAATKKAVSSYLQGGKHER
jgi:hypothetical protein